MSIVPVTFRQGFAAMSRGDGGDTSIGEAEGEFQCRADHFNAISARCAGDQTRVSMVSNHRLHAGWRHLISEHDGVHLTMEGMRIVVRNLWSAVIDGSNVSLGWS